MDLSTYYKELQTTYNLAVFALCLTIFAVLFVGIRRIINKEETTKTRRRTALDARREISTTFKFPRKAR